MKYLLYIVLNIFYFLVTIYVLLYASTFLNGYIVPYRAVGIFRGHQAIADILHIIIDLIEAVLLNLAFYIINRLMLRYDYKSAQYKTIALRTAAINLSLFLCILIYAGLYSLFHP